MLAAVAAVAIAAFVVTTWLLTIAGHAAPGTDRATARLDAVRTGLAAGAGAGAAVGLMLAFRRQHHQEIVTLLTDLDATERRITELYTKAVEQLGNEKAPVRLGGLYALERLAQDNPVQRPTIINVICAYLRMPFPAPASASNPMPATADDIDAADTEAKRGIIATNDAWEQEKQVRLAAQSILSGHLYASDEDQYSAASPRMRFWPGIRLDLIGATLIDFRLSNSTVSDVKFGGATFAGDASFELATFTGDASFEMATFTGDISFGGATFTGDASFGGATFTGDPWFGNATFIGDAWFGNTIFTRGARFGGATFTRETRFVDATFTSDASFDDATFTSDASFGNATFIGDAWFGNTTFTGNAQFDGATFTADAWFDKATFTGDAWFNQTTFTGNVQFDRATFSSSVDGLP